MRRVVLLSAMVALVLLLAGGGALAAAGDTTRVSVSSSGEQTNYDSGNTSGNTSVSSDGRFVAFGSGATNLVAGDTNDADDIFVRDRQTGTTQRVSVDSSGNQVDGNSISPSISSDGRFVAFSSNASNLVAGDTNAMVDVFVRDRQTGTTQRVSVNSSGNQAHLSRHGSYDCSISPEGRFVAFTSGAKNLVPGDTNGKQDIFVHDRRTGTTQRVSVSSSGTQGDGHSGYYYGGFITRPSISAEGRLVAFDSDATNLVSGDTNGAADVFVNEFKVDTNAPKVASVVPAREATGVSRSVNVRATFSETVYSVESNFKLYHKGSSTPVAATVHSVAGTNNRNWVLNPNRSLRAGTVYIAKVQTGVVDKVGHHLDQNPTQTGNQAKKWTFKTHS
jgi:Tol biopolymer transport system component